jgi:hypothetical protein
MTAAPALWHDPGVAAKRAGKGKAKRAAEREVAAAKPAANTAPPSSGWGDPGAWATSKRRPKAKVDPHPPSRVAAAMQLHGELTNYIGAAGRGPAAQPHLIALLDQYRESVVEPKEAEWLSRRLAELACDVAALGTSATTERLRQLIGFAKGVRELHHAKPRPQGGAWRKTAVSEPSPLDVDEAVIRLERVVGLVKVKGERGARSAEQRAVRAYNVLAEGSSASVQPDSNASRTRVVRLIRQVPRRRAPV